MKFFIFIFKKDKCKQAAACSGNDSHVLQFSPIDAQLLVPVRLLSRQATMLTTHGIYAMVHLAWARIKTYKNTTMTY
jgi:hypothetical protein